MSKFVNFFVSCRQDQNIAFIKECFFPKLQKFSEIDADGKKFQ